MEKILNKINIKPYKLPTYFCCYGVYLSNVISFIPELLIILSSTYFAVPSDAKEKNSKFRCTDVTYNTSITLKEFYAVLYYNPPAAYFIDNSNI